MTTEKLTYMISPNRTFVPYTGSIRLGSLLSDPTKPDRPLTTLDFDELVQSGKYPEIEKVTESGVEVFRSSKKTASGAIWAKFVSTVGAEVSGEGSSEERKQYTMDELRTEYFRFEPDITLLEERVSHTKVKGHMKKSMLQRAPAYMIDGIKIAAGLRVETESSDSLAGSTTGSGSVPTPAGEVEVGEKFAAGKAVSQLEKSTIGRDIVISYRLLKLWYTRWGGSLEKEEFDPGKAGFQGIEDKRENKAADQEELLVSTAAGGEIGTLRKNASVTDVELEDGSVLSLVTFAQG